MSDCLQMILVNINQNIFICSTLNKRKGMQLIDIPRKPNVLMKTV